MTMRQSLESWMDKQAPGTAEWVPVCRTITEDDTVRALCLRLAGDYEGKKIDEAEFLASLANMTGKTLEEIEQILKDTASAIGPEAIANELGIHYDGIQKGADGIDMLQFTDPKTGITFYVDNAIQARERLAEKNKEFAQAEIKTEEKYDTAAKKAVG